MEYDHLIVGGGITGMYLAYRLNQKYPKSHIGVLESASQLGGRIHTVKHKGQQFEAGAGRIGLHHQRTLALIHQMGLSDKLIEIPSSTSYITHSSQHISSESHLFHVFAVSRKKWQSVSAMWRQVLNESKNVSTAFLTDLPFVSFLYMILLPNEVQLLLFVFGYLSEVLDGNAYATIQTIQDDFRITEKHRDKAQFAVLSGGLQQLIEKIHHTLLQSSHVDVRCNERVTSMQRVHRGIQLIHTSSGQEYMAKRVYYTLPQDALLSIPYFSSDLVLQQAVRGQPTVRIYAKYPIPKGKKAWFAGLHKTVVDNPIQFIIPMNESSGLIMISYSDSYNALFWMSLKNQAQIKSHLKTYLDRLFPDRTIPAPQWIYICDWKVGFHTWNPGYNHHIVSQHVKKTYESKGIHILGETYAARQGWVEGSLESVDALLLNE